MRVSSWSRGVERREGRGGDWRRLDGVRGSSDEGDWDWASGGVWLAKVGECWGEDVGGNLRKGRIVGMAVRGLDMMMTGMRGACSFFFGDVDAEGEKELVIYVRGMEESEKRE